MMDEKIALTWNKARQSSTSKISTHTTNAAREGTSLSTKDRAGSKSIDYSLERSRKFSARAQSAMEYLMTYGWAILIIAVVLGA
ncbi:MAG: hypothetical protein QXR58_01630, partial [Candidatus Micrarchaeaceae archaeon]